MSKPMKGVKPDFSPPTCTPAEAFEVYRSLSPEERTVTKALEILKGQGHKISRDVLYRWSREYAWKAGTQIDRKSILTDIEMLAVQGRTLNSSVYQGLQAQIIAHISERIADVKITTPADVQELLKADEMLKAAAHHARGMGDLAPGDDNVIGLGEFKARK